MKTSVLLALSLGLVLAGCNKSTKSANTAGNENATGSDYTATTTTASNDLNSAANSAANALGNAANNIGASARMAEWHLTPSDIQADLDNNKEIIRTKENASGTATGATDKSVIESMVKGRLEADSDIAALKLHVGADRHGEVTLRGKAHSAEEVGRAIALALDTEGVVKVTSKIKLDKDAKTNR